MSRLAGLALIFVLARPAGALSSNVAGNSAEFLTIGVGGRALGMAEAYGPVVDGAEAIYWNPAGLVGATSPEVSYSHAELLTFFRHDHLAFAMPAPLLGGNIGFGATMWTMDELDARTKGNSQRGRFAPHSEAFSLGYARSFWEDTDMPARDREYFQDQYDFPWTTRPLREEDPLWHGSLRAGVAAKFISETILNSRATALAFDGGAQYYPFQLQGMVLSLNFKNIGTRPTFRDKKDTLPAEFTGGAAYDVRVGGKRIIPSLELSIPYYGDFNLRLGVEYSVAAGENTRLAFRAGYKTVSARHLNPMSGATVGVGFKVHRFGADFGFQPMAELGNTFRLSMNYKF